MNTHESTLLMNTSREWARAVASGDLEKVLSFWADDAVVLAPDQPAVVGRDAIRAFVINATRIPGFSLTWEPASASLSEDGTMGYLLEHNRTTFADASGALQTQHGKVVTVWRKQADGAWKCVVDAWNGNPAP